MDREKSYSKTYVELDHNIPFENILSLSVLIYNDTCTVATNIEAAGHYEVEDNIIRLWINEAGHFDFFCYSRNTTNRGIVTFIYK